MCIIKLIIQCQQSPYPSYPIPFSSAECRQALYHVLLCCLLSNTPHVPSPINHAVKLFSGGLQDADLKVRVWGKNPGEKGQGVGREGVATGREGGRNWERRSGNWERRDANCERRGANWERIGGNGEGRGGN